VEEEATANNESSKEPAELEGAKAFWDNVTGWDTGTRCPPQEEAAWRRKASPLSQQEGGSHYRDMAIQPFEYITRNALGFGEGCVIKYVSRWRNKNGVEDLRKAKHILELMIAECVHSWAKGADDRWRCRHCMEMTFVNPLSPQPTNPTARKDRSTPEGKRLWEAAEQAHEKVSTWPAWKRAPQPTGLLSVPFIAATTTAADTPQAFDNFTGKEIMPPGLAEGIADAKAGRVSLLDMGTLSPQPTTPTDAERVEALEACVVEARDMLMEGCQSNGSWLGIEMMKAHDILKRAIADGGT
jgi:hypothetical protein